MKLDYDWIMNDSRISEFLFLYFSEKADIANCSSIAKGPRGSSGAVPARLNRRDPDFKALRHYLTTGRHEAFSTQPKRATIFKQAKQFSISNGKLMCERGGGIYEYVESEESRRKLLDETHR